MRRRGHKYGAVRTTVNGRTFPSKVEAAYYAELLLRTKAGDITELVLQPVVRLAAGITYKPDFMFYDCRAERDEWVEVKGVFTDRFRLILKLWKHSGPGLLRVVGRKTRRQGFTTLREIRPEQ